MPEPELNALLDEFFDQFSETLPEGLPPERNIGHTIPLEPGNHKPPFKHAYRLSPRELAEARSLCRRRVVLCACVLTTAV